MWTTSQKRLHVVRFWYATTFCKRPLSLHILMRLNKYLTHLTTRSAGVVSGQSFGSSVVSLPCITSMCSVQCFLPAILFVQPLDHSFTPILPPLFILPLLNQCDRCLVPLAWRLMAGGRGFASHGAQLCLGAGCAISGSFWTSRAPTSTKRRSC